MPTSREALGGPIEQFTHAGATIVAEQCGDPASETTFALVHGMGMGRSVFGDFVRHVDGRGLAVAIDQPGYGEAPEPPRTPTMERTADLVAAYLRHLDRGPVTLIGHSMGTQVAVEVAARHPDVVAHLVLVAPTVDRHHRHALTQLARLGRDLLDESPKVLLLGAREYLRAGPHLRRKLRAMLTHRPELVYPRIAASTLVVRGDRDLVSPAAWCREVVRTIPDAVGVEIPGRGHETLISDARPVAEEILRFIGVEPVRP